MKILLFIAAIGGLTMLIAGGLTGSKEPLIPPKPMVTTKQERTCADMLDATGVYKDLGERERLRYCRAYIKNNPRSFGNE